MCNVHTETSSCGLFHRMASASWVVSEYFGGARQGLSVVAACVPRLWLLWLLLFPLQFTSTAPDTLMLSVLMCALALCLCRAVCCFSPFVVPATSGVSLVTAVR